MKKKEKKSELEFVSLASHQLRTPLTIMKGYLSMLLEGEFGAINNKKQKAAIAAVYSANERLVRLVENLLNFAQLEKKKINKTNFNFSLMMKEVIKEMKPQAKWDNLALQLVMPTKKIFIKADELMLRQVLINLLDNAIKYTKSGKVKVVVSMKNKKLLISVIDTGPGTDPKNLKKIFEKFERRKVQDANDEGFGLGLYACRIIIEVHNGKIWAQTRGKGFGFKVNIEIPIK